MNIKYDFNSLNLEEVKAIVLESSNYSSVLRKFGFSTNSVTRKRLQDYLKENNIDTSHFTFCQEPIEGANFNLETFKKYLQSHNKLDT
jgi:hypothetical protein